MLAFAGFAFFVAALYGFYVVLFAYLVEDRFFQGLLQQEAERQHTHYLVTGAWAPPQLPFVSLHVDPHTLPDGLATRLDAEPWRREFDAPDGRHYHLQPLRQSGHAVPAWLAAEVSQQLVVRPMRSGIAQWLGWSSLAVLVLALSIGAWIAHRLTAPLDRLAKLIEEAEPSRLPVGFAAGFPDNEVGTLARGLEFLIRRVDDFVAREREFTRDASHELRTPLAVIRSACERLGLRQDLDNEASRQLDYVRQSSHQLEQTVSLLLALAREESQSEQNADVALLAMIERVVVDQTLCMEARDLEIRIDVPAELRVQCPRTVLHIVLTNVVGNAFVHARGGGIDIQVVDGWLQVTNAAADVPADPLRAFVKGAGSAGVGLGLAIVRRLCDRHAIALRFDVEAGRMRVGLHLQQTREAEQSEGQPHNKTSNSVVPIG